MSLPRSRAGDAIRSGQREIGQVAPAFEPAAADALRGEPAARRRPPGTARLALDVPAPVAEQFKQRARRRRFSQTAALHGALLLLGQLPDDRYDALLDPLRPEFDEA